MLRNILLCGLMVSVLTTIGCAKREGEPPRAETAMNGLMPAVDGGFEPTYLADQKQVTLAGDVSVSLEPLESFRGVKPAARSSSSESSASDEGSETPTSAAADDDEWAEEEDDGWGDEEKKPDAEKPAAEGGEETAG